MARGLRILYIENDEALLGLLGNSLAVHPAIESLEKASSSNQAFDLAAIKPFDAALVDISLGPDSLNGVELAQSLREKNEHLGIVLLSQNMTKNYLANMPGQFDYGCGPRLCGVPLLLPLHNLGGRVREYQVHNQAKLRTKAR